MVRIFTIIAMLIASFSAVMAQQNQPYPPDGVMSVFSEDKKNIPSGMNGVMDTYGEINGQAPVLQNDMVPLLQSECFFAVNSAILNADAERALNALLVLAKNDKVKSIYIDGFADPSGNKAANLQLSYRRAEAVKKWLISNGVAANKIIIKGAGAQQGILKSEYSLWRKSVIQLVAS